MKKLYFILFVLLAPMFVFSNGGDQRIVEGKYFINLSRAPFTPRAGTKTAMLVSIADVQTGVPIREEIIANVYIYKQGDVAAHLPPLFEKKGISIQGGIFELPYTFAEPGLHEIFFDFAFASNPQKVYEPPDFLLDVQKPEVPIKNSISILTTIGSVFLGSLVGWIVGRRKLFKLPAS